MTALLATERISKAFGGVHALSDCTIEVEAGSITGLIGPNGSGKTTLFNVITGYERPDAGDVYFAGRKITERVAAAGVRRWHRPYLPAHQDLPQAHGPGEHARRRTAHQQRAWPGAQPAGQAGGPADRHRAMELLEFTGIAKHASALAGTLVLRAAQAARACLRPGRRPGDRAARRARRDQSVARPPHRRPDQGAERGREDVPASSSTTWSS